MQDDAELLALIRANPDDDDARLVLADTLIEQSDPRGELIGVQCALARLADYAEARRRKLIAQQNKLLRQIAQSWEEWTLKQGRLERTIVTSDRYRDKETLRCAFVRGFIEDVDADVNAFEHHIDWLVEHAPMLRSLRVRIVRIGISAARCIELLHRLPPLASLTIPQRIQPIGELTRELAKSKRFESLRDLGLSLARTYDPEGTAESLAALAEGTALTGLKKLDLYEAGLDSQSLQVLQRAPFELRALLLNANELGSAGADLLASDGPWRNLEELGLYNNGLEAQGVATLARSASLAGLKSLDLRSNRLRSQGARALGEKGAFPLLETISLVGNSFDAEAIDGLCGPGMESLQHLNLQHTRLTDECIAVLTAAPKRCGMLRSLSLRSNKLTDVGVGRLADCAALAGLTELNVNGNKSVSAAGIAALKRSPHLANAIIYAGNKRLKR